MLPGWEILLLGSTITAIAACLQGTIGFGFAIASVPLLALIDPRLAPVPQLVLSAPLVLMMAWRERAAIEPGAVGWILLGRIPGALVGVGLLKVFSAETLGLLLAVIILIAIGLLMRSTGIRQNATTQFIAGITSGVMGLVASMGGPPLALLFRNSSGPSIRANLAAVFAVGLGITIITRVVADEMSWDDVMVAICMMPGLVIGFLSSRILMGRVRGESLRRTILLVAGFAALGLIVRSIAS